MTTWSEFYEKYDEWADSTILNRISSLKDMGPSDEITEVANCINDDASEKLIKKAHSMGTVFSPEEIADIADYIEEDLTDDLVERYMSTRKPLSYKDIENLDGLVSDQMMDKIILYDLGLGYGFTAKQIIDLDGIVSEAVLTKALQISNPKLTKRDIENLYGVVDEQVLFSIDRKLGTHVYDDEIEEDDWEEDDDEEDDSYDYADTSGKKPGFLDRLGTFLFASSVDKKMREKREERLQNEAPAWMNRKKKYSISERVYVRRYGSRQSGTIIDVSTNGYAVKLDDGTFLTNVRESDIERGIF